MTDPAGNAEVPVLAFGKYEGSEEPMRFDLVDLRLFLHVAEARSITHGARRANLALASASERIRGMEQKLGVALLARDRRGVSLTPAGQSVVDHARLILRQVESLQGELGVHARGLTGTVRVLSNTAAFSEHLPKLLVSFLANNPAISVDLEERESSDIGALIASGSGDIGIASETALSDALETLPFRTDRLVAVAAAGDALARRRQIRFGELIGRTFVGLPHDSALQLHLARHAALQGAAMRLRVRVSGFDAVCRMAEAGVGIGVVPEVAARRCRRSMRIAIVPLAEAWATRRLVLCVRQMRGLAVPARRLVEHLGREAA
jgi:DNA-binding transcriptional LysR family regulator